MTLFWSCVQPWQSAGMLPVGSSASTKATVGMSVEYSMDFWTLAADMGWNDAALQGVCVKGLKWKPQRWLITPDEPSCLSELVSLAIKLDNWLRERRQERDAHLHKTPKFYSLPWTLLLHFCSWLSRLASWHVISETEGLCDPNILRYLLSWLLFFCRMHKGYRLLLYALLQISTQ